ncbi:S1/P1 nuclease [Pseudoxanthomonas spadix]|uniref:S1/P1 nuclease n=1 Tax=Pseudoxanthomonas spadix TaxID=415229 RepID=UPI0005B8A1F6|nr:S1/P1 nuclease [Pseudoxanthomonas spadix]
MNRTAVLASLAALALLLHIPQALAWGLTGHRLVAELAEPDLTPATRVQLDRLLASEPGATLPGIATWADELRKQDAELGKRSARWHYVNLGESDCHYDPPRDCRNGDCNVGAIKTQTAILADRSLPDAQRLQALKFVVHLVGDAHQPLHAGYAGDKGGNDRQVNVDGKGSNLHALWDSGLLRRTGLDEDALLAQIRALPAPAEAEQPMPVPPPAAAWAQAACRIALAPGLYPPGAKIDQAYFDTWTPVAQRQLRLAGARLAQVLNAALDNS